MVVIHMSVEKWKSGFFVAFLGCGGVFSGGGFV